MSWSLHIKGGDLNLGGPDGFAIVTGTQKLIQDLKNWLLEPRGTDPLHLDFGSTIDGGTLPDGTMVGTQIGSIIDKERLLDIEAELRRVLVAYQQQQLERLQRESITLGGKNTFAPGELLASVLAVNVEQFSDVILARIKIRTQTGNVLSFTQPLG